MNKLMLYREDGAAALVQIVSDEIEQVTGSDMRVVKLLVVKNLQPSPFYGPLPQPGEHFQVKARPGYESVVGWSLDEPAAKDLPA
jgi:hypothetical protein